MSVCRQRFHLTGIVQGVGIRPFIHKLATELDLVGWVRNAPDGVFIEVQGPSESLFDFRFRLQADLPPLAQVDSISVEPISAQSDREFLILESSGAGSFDALVSPDVAICPDCTQELMDKGDRRYLYPFINCTNCGPRFTIVEDMPYDRSRTTMKSFAMCRECQSEYSDPSNRRFHAQPNACAECGPRIWMVDSAAPVEQFDSPIEIHSAQHVINGFKSAIQAGKIVAIKGIGGFHLACDATNRTAVARLRERKGRVDKPFAMMVRDVEVARTVAKVSTRERQLLESRERPIVLLSKCENTNCQADNVSPGNDFVGVMLPYSPLHCLLVGDTPLIMTSGNLAEEPIVWTNRQASARLTNLADLFLLHDRDIHVVCDDSIVRSIDDGLVPIRRSRGYCPMPVPLGFDGPNVLAVGGEQKSTFCLTKGKYAFVSQHIGDMGNAETLAALSRNVEHFERLFQAEPSAVCADLHPSYLSSQWAKTFAKARDLPFFQVQHHFAHVVSLMAEHGLQPDSKIIGCCFDGTGYGTDQTIWGGEFLIADSVSFVRFAALNEFPLPGGDATILRPSRAALSMLWSQKIGWDHQLYPAQFLHEKERRLLLRQLERGLNCVPTSSMGRLFDGVAALIGIRQEINYEAQAAMELEAMAAQASQVTETDYGFELSRETIWRLNTAKLLLNICADVRRGVAKHSIAAKFHLAVANAIGMTCQVARDETGIDTVGLTGGVFQNIVLLKLATQRLSALGFRVLTHAVLPPNDGGISVGQAVIVRNWMKHSRPRP